MVFRFTTQSVLTNVWSMINKCKNWHTYIFSICLVVLSYFSISETFDPSVICALNSLPKLHSVAGEGMRLKLWQDQWAMDDELLCRISGKQWIQFCLCKYHVDIGLGFHMRSNNGWLAAVSLSMFVERAQTEIQRPSSVVECIWIIL